MFTGGCAHFHLENQQNVHHLTRGVQTFAHYCTSFPHSIKHITSKQFETILFCKLTKWRSIVAVLKSGDLPLPLCPNLPLPASQNDVELFINGGKSAGNPYLIMNTVELQYKETY